MCHLPSSHESFPLPFVTACHLTTSLLRVPRHISGKAERVCSNQFIKIYFRQITWFVSVTKYLFFRMFREMLRNKILIWKKNYRKYIMREKLDNLFRQHSINWRYLKCAILTLDEKPSIFIRDNPIFSSEGMLHRNYDSRNSVERMLWSWSSSSLAPRRTNWL
jgi:hypothetical protein